MSDGTTIIIALISTFGTVIVAGIGALVTLSVANRKTVKETDRKVDDLHITVDGRLSQLLDETRISSRQEGMLAERKIGADRAAGVEVNRAIVEADRSLVAEHEAEARTPNPEGG